MAQTRLTEQEWETFLGLADRLGINVRSLLEEDVRFHVLESAGHELGRAVGRATTEWLTLVRAQRLLEPQPCPTCGRRCPVAYRERELESIDGPINLQEAMCECPACRRAFFPSASCVGSGPTEL